MSLTIYTDLSRLDILSKDVFREELKPFNEIPSLLFDKSFE